MRRTSLDVFVVVTLFCVYTASALILCMIGAQVYRSTANTMSQNYDTRTSVLYIAEKVRHNDIDGTVRIEEFNGSDALVLTEKQSGKDYDTWLFVQDHLLYEGLFAPGVTPDPRLCQPILPLDSLSLSLSSLNGRVLSIKVITTEGQSLSMDLSLRSARGVGV